MMSQSQLQSRSVNSHSAHSHNAHNSHIDGATATATATATNAEAIEKLWAKERYEMSGGDREATSYELHGVVSRAVVETPELISKALQEFDIELNLLYNNNNNNDNDNNNNNQSSSSPHASNTYIQSSTFRLRFLRAELFNITKSVHRYCICIELLVEYFGDFALQRQLFLSDLNKDEMKMLKEGTIQILPTRDTLGRRIMVFIGNVGASYTLQIINKVGLYLIFQILAEDITTQRNGIVSISVVQNGGEDVQLRMENEGPDKFRQLFTKVLYGAPCRFTGVHICFQQSSSGSSSNFVDGFFMRNMIRPLFLFIIGKPGRKVLRIHSGSSIECDYSLKTFGIQVDDIPLTHTGTVKVKNHSRWIKVRSAMDKFIKDYANNNYQYYYSIENTIIPFPKIICPEVDCVLFRKNGVAWEYPGNIKFRAFLQELDNRIAAIIKQTRQSETAQSQQSQPQTTTENLYINTATATATATRLAAAKTTMTMTMAIGMSKDEHVEYILHEAIIRGFSFLMYDEKNHWYIELKEENELRKQLRSALRGHSKRRTRARTSYDNNNNNNNNNMLFMQKTQIGNNNSNNNSNNNNNNDEIHNNNNSNRRNINNNNIHNDDATMMDIDTTTKNSNNYSHQYSNSNSNMMDVDMIEPNLVVMVEPNPVVFTDMDGKRRKTSVCCRS
jgi:hypothetical protein